MGTQIVHKEVNTVFDNTTTYFYDEDFNVDILSPNVSHTKVYEVYQTNSIMLKFSVINFTPDVLYQNWLFGKENERRVLFTKLEHEHQVYIVQATTVAKFNTHDLESWYIQAKIEEYNANRLSVYNSI